MNTNDHVNGTSRSAHGGDVGDGIAATGSRWSFGGQTSKSFDRHVQKSVPMYRLGHRLVLKLSDYFLADGSSCYDLGCSTGTLVRKLARRHQGRDIRYIGVDVEEEMISVARSRPSFEMGIEYLKAPIERIAFEPCDLVVSYYTLQFVAPKFRQGIFDKIYQALNPGGAMILFEKVHAEDAQLQQICSDLLSDRKLAKGFSPEQIINKAQSLRGVMKPAATASNLHSLDRAGFGVAAPIVKFLSFEGVLAIKV